MIATCTILLAYMDYTTDSKENEGEEKGGAAYFKLYKKKRLLLIVAVLLTKCYKCYIILKK